MSYNILDAVRCAITHLKNEEEFNERGYTDLQGASLPEEKELREATRCCGIGWVAKCALENGYLPKSHSRATFIGRIETDLLNNGFNTSVIIHKNDKEGRLSVIDYFEDGLEGKVDNQV